jgi:hypothetical protein
MFASLHAAMGIQYLLLHFNWIHVMLTYSTKHIGTASLVYSQSAQADAATGNDAPGHDDGMHAEVWQ